MSNFTFYTTNKISSIGALSFLVASPPSEPSDYYSGTLSSLLDRDRYDFFTWSAGAHTSTTIEASIGSKVINFVALQAHNFKDFEILVNSAGVTLIDDNTTTSKWSNYTDTSTIIHFASVTASTIEIIVNSTTSGGDRQLGQFIVGEQVYVLPNNPNFSDYKPVLTGKKKTQKMFDGGFITYDISEKFSAQIKLNYMPESVTSSLRTLYNTNTSYNFVPFPTITNWNGDIYEVNWTDNYLFKQPALNQRSDPYYSGTINLRERPVNEP